MGNQQPIGGSVVRATPRRGWLCACDNGNLLCTFLYLEPHKIEGALAAFASTALPPAPVAPVLTTGNEDPER